MLTKHQEQGPREYQEDFLFTKEQAGITVVAVFDGHGGFEVASYCMRRMSLLSGLELKNICDVLARECSGKKSGTTLSIAVISKDTATIAVVGDSPILVIDDNNEISLSPEHNVRSNPESAKEVVARGGQVFDGYAWNNGHGLQMSRAIGDAGMGKVISNQPDIYTVKIGPKSVVLVASDGVFDPGHSDKMRPVQIAELLRNGADAKEIIKSAGRLQDNATAIVWRPR